MKQGRRWLCVVFLGALAVVLGIAAFQNNTSDKSLLKIFDGAYGKNVGYVGRASAEHILQCCAERALAYAELEKNGFRITTRQWLPDEPYPAGFKSAEYYDETVHGQRGPGLGRIFDVFASYKITIFIRDGRVAKVSARIDRTMP